MSTALRSTEIMGCRVPAAAACLPAAFVAPGRLPGLPGVLVLRLVGVDGVGEGAEPGADAPEFGGLVLRAGHAAQPRVAGLIQPGVASRVMVRRGGDSSRRESRPAVPWPQPDSRPPLGRAHPPHRRGCTAADLTWGTGLPRGEAVTMATAGKPYVVEDAGEGADPGGETAIFPGTLRGLLDALDAARYRSAAGSPKMLVIVEGKERQVIRRYEHGTEVWSASSAQIRRERGKDASR